MPGVPLGPVKKKNFLEVLRPDAPIREWDDAAGEWVERPPPKMLQGEEQETARG